MFIFLPLRSSSSCKYDTIKTAEGYLQVKRSNVVGLGGSSTGNGVFTLKDIFPGTWIVSYAPLAPFCRLGSNRSNTNTDYLLELRCNDVVIEVDGSLCPLGIGKVIQDGTLSFCLLPSKFSSLIKSRLNCEFADRNGEIWLRSSRHIHAGEELLTRYSHNSSYWYRQFTTEQLNTIKTSLQSCPDNTLLHDAENIISTIQL